MSKLNIAIVDDDPLDVAFVRRHLREVAEADDIAVYPSLEEAESALKHGAMDVLVLDLGLPGIRGVEAVRTARAWARDGLPIVVLTGQDADSDLARECIRAGADDYVTKDEGATMLRRAVVYGECRARGRMIRVLESIMERHRLLSHAATQPGVARDPAPLEDREPEEHEAVAAGYRACLRGFMTALQDGQSYDRDRVRSLVDRLGALDATSSDVLALHDHEMDGLLSDSQPAEIERFLADTQKLSIAVLSRLSDFYRHRSRLR